jgi:hypothetical protein
MRKHVMALPDYLSYKLCIHVIHFGCFPVITYVCHVIIRKMSIFIRFYVHHLVIILPNGKCSSLLAFSIKLELPLLLCKNPGGLHARCFTQLVATELTVLSSFQVHFTVAIFHTEVCCIVPGLHRTPEEGPT